MCKHRRILSKSILKHSPWFIRYLKIYHVQTSADALLNLCWSVLFVLILDSRAWLMGSTHWCLSTIMTTRGAEVLLPTRTGTFTSWQWHSWYDVTRHAWIHYFLTINIWNIFKSWGKTTGSRGSCRLTTSTTTMLVRPEASPTGVRETAETAGSASTGGTP